jgi:hypothetical protein
MSRRTATRVGRRVGCGAVMVEVLATNCFRTMELITILSRCHRFQGFVYHHARFSPDRKSIEVAVRPRKGSAALCSRCHQPAPGYDQLAERRFEFIAALGLVCLPAVHHAARRLPALWRRRRRRGSVGRRQTQPDQSLHAVSGPLGRAVFHGRKPPGPFTLPGIRFSTRSTSASPACFGWAKSEPSKASRDSSRPWARKSSPR